MKRLLLILIIGCYSAIAGSPPNNVITIIINKPINPYLRLSDAVAMVESGIDDNAYNEAEMATGRYQIRPIRLLDYNRRTGENYSLQDMYNPEISKKVFLYYASKYKPNEYERIARHWNGRYSKTKEYWLKVKQCLI